MGKFNRIFPDSGGWEGAKKCMLLRNYKIESVNSKSKGESSIAVKFMKQALTKLVIVRLL